MLRHQSSPVQQGERNNSVALGSGGGEGTLGRPPKNLYPTLQSKDNRCETIVHIIFSFSFLKLAFLGLQISFQSLIQSFMKKPMIQSFNEMFYYLCVSLYIILYF